MRVLTNFGTNYYKYIATILSLCCFGLVVAILVLDTQSSTVYTYAQKFSGEALFDTWYSYYKTILGLIIGFIVWFFIVQCFCFFFTYGFKDMPNLPIRYLEYIIFEFLIVLIILLAHDSVIVNFLQCVNAIRRGVLTAKAICTIVLMVLIFIRLIIHLVISRMESEKTSVKTTLTTIVFTAYSLTLLAIIGLNIAILVMVNHNIKIWTKGDIGIGLYNKNEIQFLRNGTLSVNSSMYETHYLTSLDSLFNTKDEMMVTARSSNITSPLVKQSLTRYSKIDHYRRVIIDIDCYNPLYPSDIFKDCSNASSGIRFILQYDEKKKKFPVYNCVIMNNTSCSLGCPWFESTNYKFMLISEHNDTLQLAWNGLSRCDDVSENIINLDIGMYDMCTSSAQQPKYNILVSLILISLFTLFM